MWRNKYFLFNDKVKSGREEAIREYGKNIEQAVKGSPQYLRH